MSELGGPLMQLVRRATVARVRVLVILFRLASAWGMCNCLHARHPATAGAYVHTLTATVGLVPVLQG